MAALSTLSQLKQEIVLRGWNRKATGRVILELSIHILFVFGGMVGFLATGKPWLGAICLCISAVGTVGVATNSHTSSHYATSNKSWLNEALSYLGHPALTGLSATYWWHKHVVTHHSAPNVIGEDGDADLLPWFAMTADEVHASQGFRRFYYQRLQFWAFPFALAMNAFSIQVSGWRFLIGRLRDSRRRRAHWIDLAAMLSHYTLFLVLPCLWWPPSAVFLTWVLRSVLLGYGLYAVLAPAHFPAEALRSTRESLNRDDFLALQTMATINFRTGRLGRFVCSGLEYQIEHHLFPNISHVHYPQMSVAVRKFCQEQGLPYRCYGWVKLLWNSWMVLRSPQPVVRLTGIAELEVGRSGTCSVARTPTSDRS